MLLTLTPVDICTSLSHLSAPPFIPKLNHYIVTHHSALKQTWYLRIFLHNLIYQILFIPFEESSITFNLQVIRKQQQTNKPVLDFIVGSELNKTKTKTNKQKRSWCQRVHLAQLFKWYGPLNKDLQHNNSDTYLFAYKIKTNYFMTKQVVYMHI